MANILLDLILVILFVAWCIEKARQTEMPDIKDTEV